MFELICLLALGEKCLIQISVREEKLDRIPERIEAKQEHGRKREVARR